MWKLLLVSLVTILSHTDAVFAKGPGTEVKLIPDVEQIAPGDTLLLGVHFSLQPGWHIYGKDPGSAGLPTKITLMDHAQVDAEEVRWPTPEKFLSGEEVSFGYSHEVLLTLPVRIKKDAQVGETDLEVKVKWLNCSKSLCVPEKAMLPLKIRIGTETLPKRVG
ncbi:MAG: hypothetical protein KDD55_03785 [Bdellovibrionales bacterium]|nr:hypothetical protein [Bdellovibrionales bacterium]